MVEVVFLFYYLLAQSYRCVVIWTPLAVRVDRFGRAEAPRRAGLTLVWVCFQRVGEKFGFFPAVCVCAGDGAVSCARSDSFMSCMIIWARTHF